ncbi:MAG: pyrroline-5-carboxylate reductase [Holophagales bacterium]|nr:pyrroline-5-carboxylate reductase [Holophagales bacterium]MYF96837.1 pyrroline-5-carboxylate reductase [Holophagales bacterium]
MGRTLIGGWLDAGAVATESIFATAGHEERIAAVSERFGIEGAVDNRRAAEFGDIVLLAVKPQTADEVLAEIGDLLHPGQILVSILASVRTSYIEDRVPAEVPVVRAMPNTPSRVAAGMTALCAGRFASPEHVELAERLFRPLGRTVVADEKHMDAITGLSASGPAFLYIVIEALAEGGVKAGLPRKMAIELAAQSCLGAGKMVIDTDRHPALLKDEVTTPAGCTVDGILRLEEGGLRVTLIKAIIEAAARARELVPDE